MNQPFAHKTYVFHEQINVPYINDLYSEDYEIIAETFADVLAEYPSLEQNIDTSFQARDLLGLKRAIHKIKPLFGFTGLTALQDQCQGFEQACERSTSFDAVLPEFNQLKKNITEAQNIIEKETTGLALFNSR